MTATTRNMGPVDTGTSPGAHFRTLSFAGAKLVGGFWTEQQMSNRVTSLRHGYEMLEKAGNFHNLRLAAGRATGSYRGRNFYDEDVYKWLEALGWELGNGSDPGLQDMADEVIELIAAAQEPDGYLDSYYQVVEPQARWADLDHGHELYCAGHLFQAAVAFARSVGDRRLLDVSRRLADHIDDTFGPGKVEGTGGHPQIEMALVELYRATGEDRYLALARLFIDRRGRGAMRGYGTLAAEYHQDHLPVRKACEPAGHAVRQMYLLTGVADLYLESGEAALWEAMERMWRNVTEGHLFVTGGLGARFDGESFGEPYELPPDQCYCETCAAIGSFMWNWRLLLATGESRYADLMERTLYNAILCSRDLDGRHYFYVNPLQLRGGRSVRLSTNPEDGTDIVDGRPEWHYVACCPPNVMRLISSYSHYLATTDEGGVQIHHYAEAVIDVERAAGSARIRMHTDYPWEGWVRLTIEETDPEPWSLALRLPEWCSDYTLFINGDSVRVDADERGYLVLEGLWQVDDVVALTLEMAPQWILPNPRIDAVRGSVALQRGPMIYCAESQDLDEAINLLDVSVDVDRTPVVSWQPELLGGVMTVQAEGVVSGEGAWRGRLYRPVGEIETEERPVTLTLLPYFRWGNRGLDGMRVWLPRRGV